jgi:hypothetical protein
MRIVDALHQIGADRLWRASHHAQDIHRKHFRHQADQCDEPFMVSAAKTWTAARRDRLDLSPDV